MRRGLLVVLMALFGCGTGDGAVVSNVAPTSTVPPPTRVRPADLFAHPEWVGTTVTVDLIEDLLDENWTSAAPKGGYDVEVMNLQAQRLRLVPAAAGEAGMTTLSGLTPPIRVTGVLKTAKFGLDIVPATIEQLAFEAPIKLGDPKEMLTNPKVTSGTVVEVTGDWMTGFEASILGETAWVGGYRTGKRICEPPRGNRVEQREYTTTRVRIVGVVYNQPDYGYGHLNRMRAEIKAIEMEWLSPRDPACK